mmetsp:Transcript_1791/g.2538  ORF Transcript_1791/g.2538 Transcript_1791/m.2538 type:complete len:693 (+) Transcript_1791:35-2113(+)
MPSVLSKYKKEVGLGSIIIGLALFYQFQKNRRRTSETSTTTTKENRNAASASEAALNVVQKVAQASSKGASQQRVAVDGVFFSRLWRILKIVVPGFFSTEMFFILLVASALVSRTYCDLWLLRVTTHIERIIISRNAKAFPRGIMMFLIAMLPIALVNNILKYGLAEMSLRFRTRLTEHLYEHYLSGYTYYQINNLDNRIANPDQLLTQDLQRFSQSLTDLYSNISKPLLDLVIYSKKLSGALGSRGPASMLGYLAVSGIALTALRRPTARFTIKEQQLEGAFRFVNSRLIINSEEVAFYQGAKKEEGVLKKAYQQLCSHVRRSQQFRCSLGVLDHVIAKYFATVVGFLVVSVPFLDLNHPRHKNSTHNEIMEDYYRSGRMLMNLAMAVGRLVLAGRELTRLAGFTARMTELMEVLNDLNNGRYKRTMVQASSDDAASSSSADNTSGRGGGMAERRGLKPNNGTIEEVDHLIRFEKVPLVTPNGDVLVESLDFTVKSGQNVLVCGPNGCGKSSLFRILGELWPLFGGKLLKPAKEKLFYVPQRPYMTLGTLRDQIIYPHTLEQMKAQGLTDDDLVEYLEGVHLADLPSRFNQGLDAVEDWMDVLSGGEKQRVAMARLFYHRPQFAILDECTSAVSVDVEGYMYSHSRDLGITLFTVSHRKSLWKYHEYVLYFDGKGAYKYCKRDEMDSEFGS